MRLGVTLGHVAGATPEEYAAVAREADRLGYAVAWAPEAYGVDSPTVLAWAAAHTERLDLGSAVMQIPARTPAMTAMTAATLDRLSGGRFRLGLGVSGPQVSEGWHGVRFDQPLPRTREYVDIVRLALSGRTVSYDGAHFTLPLPDGPGKALKLAARPVRDRVPVYLAAVGPKNLELAGEVADGWLAVFFSPRHAGDQLAHLDQGLARADRSRDGFDVSATVPVVVGDDVAACAEPVRAYAALYVGGMGSREQNFYHQLARRMGYAEAADRVQELFLAKRHRQAMAAVPLDFVDETSLLGPRQRITERLHDFADAGVTTLTVSPFAPTLAAKLQQLRVVAEALAASGFGA
ncbi:MAG: LLM class F420-dependent oxidoreductase [Actinomycetota bacterium]|nr:LLM class F420-dependent oxidoreductase [Actinomycetota bacterium]